MVWLPLVIVAAAQVGPKEALDPHLEPLRPLLGKTYKGVFKNSTPENPLVDVARWDRILNGQAVRMAHSINDGAYGGETVFRWDPQKKAVTYHYFTTASFMTVGTVEFKEGKVVTEEAVVGEAGGVTKVAGSITVQKDGGYLVHAVSTASDGATNTRETTYKLDDKARVIFR